MNMKLKLFVVGMVFSINFLIVCATNEDLAILEDLEALVVTQPVAQAGQAVAAIPVVAQQTEQAATGVAQLVERQAAARVARQTEIQRLRNEIDRIDRIMQTPRDIDTTVDAELDIVLNLFNGLSEQRTAAFNEMQRLEAMG